MKALMLLCLATLAFGYTFRGYNQHGDSPCAEGSGRRDGRMHTRCVCDETGCVYVPTGCYTHDHGIYYIGIGTVIDMIDAYNNGFRLTCERVAARVRISVLGCVVNNSSVSIGSTRTFADKNVQFQCAVSNAQAVLRIYLIDPEGVEYLIEDETKTVEITDMAEAVMERRRVIAGMDHDDDAFVKESSDVSEGSGMAVEPPFNLANLTSRFGCGALYPGELFHEGSFYGACVCESPVRCKKRVLGCYSSQPTDHIAAGRIVNYIFSTGLGMNKKCAQISDNEYSFNATECVYSLRTIQRDEFVENSNMKITCMSEKHGMEMRPARPLPVSGKNYRREKCEGEEAKARLVARDGVVSYEVCSCDETGCQDKPVGCYAKFSDSKIDIGEGVNHTTAVAEWRRVPIGVRYECRLDCGGTIELVATGCFHGGAFLARGERAMFGDGEDYWIHCDDHATPTIRWQKRHPTAPDPVFYSPTAFYQN